ncbi:hypothetical protein QTO34_011426 [Cnephaeus nilssonii]|uniref:Uncharacterized protein n=1 Tax=Cnephaeus nilssonii TaxID=3371016 RepID=A0AA40HDH3_CNENI|nr:hypothetical protein QTO34_011426 [Eptesicus nilssonii]
MQPEVKHCRAGGIAAGPPPWPGTTQPQVPADHSLWEPRLRCWRSHLVMMHSHNRQLLGLPQLDYAAVESSSLSLIHSVKPSASGDFRKSSDCNSPARGETEKDTTAEAVLPASLKQAQGEEEKDKGEKTPQNQARQEVEISMFTLRRLVKLPRPVVGKLRLASHCGSLAP